MVFVCVMMFIYFFFVFDVVGCWLCVGLFGDVVLFLLLCLCL